MKPSITPEELVRMQGLAERLFSHIHRVPKKRRDYFVNKTAPLIIGELPANFAFPPAANQTRNVKLNELEGALESLLWAAAWAIGMYQNIKGSSAVTFNLDACETHLDKFDSLI